MSQQFIFSFSGEDIENAPSDTDIHRLSSCPATEPKVVLKAPTTAFPVDGQVMLPNQAHDLDSLLSALPSKIAYGVLLVTLDDGTEIAIPRRELWDIRVQLMAESDPDGVEAGLGKDDIKAGIYEGGFKSWESSVDLVKVLAVGRTKGSWTGKERRILEVLHINSFNVPI
jgi:protein-histidine N-methyltransferase